MEVVRYARTLNWDKTQFEINGRPEEEEDGIGLCTNKGVVLITLTTPLLRNAS